MKRCRISMWFGGPHQALAAKHPEVVPIGTLNVSRLAQLVYSTPRPLPLT